MDLTPDAMSDDELRAVVRESIARVLNRPIAAEAPDAGAIAGHPSHLRLLIVSSGGDADGACLIEPSVRCTHCGYCQSYGH
jgi:hypothetical protein